MSNVKAIEAIGQGDKIIVTNEGEAREVFDVARNMAQAVKDNASLVAGTNVHFEGPGCYIGDSNNNLFKIAKEWHLSLDVSVPIYYFACAIDKMTHR